MLNLQVPAALRYSTLSSCCLLFLDRHCSVTSRDPRSKSQPPTKLPLRQLQQSWESTVGVGALVTSEIPQRSWSHNGRSNLASAP